MKQWGMEALLMSISPVMQNAKRQTVLKGAATAGWPGHAEPSGLTNPPVEWIWTCMQSNLNLNWDSCFQWKYNRAKSSSSWNNQQAKAFYCCWVVWADSWCSANRWRQMYEQGQSQGQHQLNQVMLVYIIPNMTCCYLCHLWTTERHQLQLNNYN